MSSAVVSAAQKEEAVAVKNAGNEHFKLQHYQPALVEYSKAIELDGTVPAFYSNRSICQLKLENLGLAYRDACTAIELDGKYAKGYYRRASALLAQGNIKDALKDFRKAVKLVPTDRASRLKVKQCKERQRELALAEALAEDIHNWDYFQLTDDYTGPRWDQEGKVDPSVPVHLQTSITKEFVLGLVEYFKEGGVCQPRWSYRIVTEVTKLLASFPSLVDVPIPEGTEITVCGDVHGQFFDFIHIFETNGYPSEENPYLFNGDFVDRGSWSLEVVLTLFAFKLLYPNHFHMTRGNHETRSMNLVYGFQGEVQAKIDSGLFELFSDAFDWLPLAYCLQESVLVLHGGLFSEDGVTLDDIRKVKRNKQPSEQDPVMNELLWSDPMYAQGRQPSKRGVGCMFGPDVSHRFLDANNLSMLVRSHEVKQEGYEVMHEGRVITIFSAPNYVDNVGNKGAWIRFGHDCKPKFTQFTHKPHPDVKPMAYANKLYQ